MITLLMLGDSLVEWGDWSRFLPTMSVINRGIAGEMTGELAVRLADELESYPDPDVVLIQSGTNNLLFGDLFFPVIFQTMLPRIRQAYPDIPLIISSLMPMTVVPAAQLEQVNDGLKEVAEQTEHCLFLDVREPFNEYCLPITHPGFLTDQVHLSTRGYQVWAKTIHQCINNLFPSQASPLTE